MKARLFLFILGLLLLAPVLAFAGEIYGTLRVDGKPVGFADRLFGTIGDLIQKIRRPGIRRAGG